MSAPLDGAAIMRIAGEQPQSMSVEPRTRGFEDVIDGSERRGEINIERSKSCMVHELVVRLGQRWKVF